jgi:hypothetical protein
MSAPFVQDPLRGKTLPDAKADAALLLRRADQLTAHIARYHYSPRSLVGLNLRAERDACEREAHFLLLEIAEVEEQQSRRVAS